MKFKKYVIAGKPVYGNILALSFVAMPDSNSTESIELSNDLIERIETRIHYTEFESTNEYIEFFLEEMMAKIEDPKEDTREESFDGAEVRNQLQALGYLNE